MSDEPTGGAAAEGGELPIVIIGSGFSGLGMGILLKQAGIHSFTILEKAGDVGGTWRDNVYPGAACDIPSHLYSYSFEPNPAWSRAFSPQPEILGYLRRCAKKYGIEPHIRFHAEVERAVFDDATATWTVHTKDGKSLRARALVVGNGALHIPAFPAIEGRESFQGKAFHSARWDHEYDLTGKRVAVIGTGASAIQFVPQIAPKVSKLHLFQRTPPWIVPRLDRAFSDAERSAFERLPIWHRAYRASIYWKLEAQVLGFTSAPVIMKLGAKLAKKHLEASIQDPKLRAALTPNYRMGCKRILLSDDYYPALTRPNVELVTDSIEAITPAGVLTRSGALREVDVIVYGTGFNVSEYIAPIHIQGLGGRDLNTLWRVSPEAYLGITVSGFPNLYLLMGPNTGLGHNSMIFMIEAQVRYALQCIQALRDRGLSSMDVRPDVMTSFNAVLQDKLSRTVWASGCRSWYQTESGRNSTIWPGFTFDYWRRTRRVELSDYVLR